MMHIPKVTTDQLELVTFDEALEAANTPCTDYDIQKWLYAPPFYSEYRYILGTRGKNPLICIGINPSTAEPDNLDNTLKSVERIALGNGFDRMSDRHTIFDYIFAFRNGAERILVSVFTDLYIIVGMNNHFPLVTPAFTFSVNPGIVFRSIPQKDSLPRISSTVGFFL